MCPFPVFYSIIFSKYLLKLVSLYFCVWFCWPADSFVCFSHGRKLFRWFHFFFSLVFIPKRNDKTDILLLIPILRWCSKIEGIHMSRSNDESYWQFIIQMNSFVSFILSFFCLLFLELEIFTFQFACSPCDRFSKITRKFRFWMENRIFIRKAAFFCLGMDQCQCDGIAFVRQSHSCHIVAIVWYILIMPERHKCVQMVSEFH